MSLTLAGGGLGPKGHSPVFCLKPPILLFLCCIMWSPVFQVLSCLCCLCTNLANEIFSPVNTGGIFQAKRCYTQDHQRNLSKQCKLGQKGNGSLELLDQINNQPGIERILWEGQRYSNLYPVNFVCVMFFPSLCVKKMSKVWQIYIIACKDRMKLAEVSKVLLRYNIKYKFVVEILEFSFHGRL